MRPSRVIQGTFITMMFLQIIGSTDRRHRLPAPRQFVPVFVLWGILFLMGGTQLGRLAARLSVLILLTGAVLGPFGQTALTFLRKVTAQETGTFQGGIGGGTFSATDNPDATHIS